MNLIFHIDKEYEEDLIDSGLTYMQSRYDADAYQILIASDDDDEVLIESLSTEELAEFFGLPEDVIYLEIDE